MQLYTHQRTSRDKVPVQAAAHASTRCRWRPVETRTVRLTLPRRRPGALGRDARQVGGRVVDLRRPGRILGDRHPGGRPRCGSTARRSRPATCRSRPAPRTSTGMPASTWSTRARSAAPPSARPTTARGSSSPTPSVDSSDTTFTATVAKADAGAGTIEVRLGSPDGQLLGTADVSSTGDVYDYTTTTASLAAANGVHDVYLVLSPGPAARELLTGLTADSPRPGVGALSPGRGDPLRRSSVMSTRHFPTALVGAALVAQARPNDRYSIEIDGRRLQCRVALCRLGLPRAEARRLRLLRGPGRRPLREGGRNTLAVAVVATEPWVHVAGVPSPGFDALFR